MIAHTWTLLPKVSVLTNVSDADAKKRRRRLKAKKPEPIFRDRSTSPCLPPALLPPPLLPPPPPQPVTTVASVVAASPSVYTMPRVFGPFPPLSGKPVSGSMLYERKSWWGGQLLFTSPAHSIGSQVSAEGLLSSSEYRLAVGQTSERACPG